MDAAHGITMGYVSGPFRTEEPASTLKGSLSQPMVEPWGGGKYPRKPVVASLRDATRSAMLMGAAPAHGITMGYVSGPFRTEEPASTLKGSLSQPMVEPWGGGKYPRKPVVASLRDATRSAMLMGAAPAHGITMGYVSGPFRTEEPASTLKGSLSQPWWYHGRG